MAALLNDRLNRRDLPLVTAFVGAAILAGLGAGIAPLPIAVILTFGVIAGVLILLEPLTGLGLALLLGPLKPVFDTYIPQVPLDPGQIALILTVGSWLIHGLKDRRVTLPASKLTLPLLIFIFAALLSLLNALSLGYAIKELIKWAQLLLVMFIVIDRGDRRRVRWVIAFILSSVFLQALIGLWQFGLRGDGPEHFLILGGRFYRAYGSFEQPNPYGGFLGLGLMLSAGITLNALTTWFSALRESVRNARPIKLAAVLPQVMRADFLRLLALIGLTGIIAGALLASWSRGAWLGAAAGAAIILFAWPQKTRYGFILLAGSALLIIIAFQANILPSAVAERLTGFTSDFQSFDVRGVDISDANYSVIERLAHWQAAREMARNHFWLGVGIGNYEPVYGAYALLNWPYPLGHAHNIYLNIFAETGLIGLLAYLGLWISIIWQTWHLTRARENWIRFIAIGLLGAWVHLSIHQLVDTLYVANIHLQLGALLGILSIMNDQSNQSGEVVHESGK